jgi:hypothetical protein
MPLQIRRGTEEERLAMSVPLAPGELLYVTDDKRLFVGDGISVGPGLIPVTGYTNEDAQDAAAALILSGDHNNITWTYNDANDKLSSTVDLSVYIGEISADGFRGNLVGDDSTILVKALNSSINLDGTVKGDIIPDLTEVYDLGSNLRRFKDLYLSGNSLYLGGAQITATGNIIELPAGSLIGGEPIGIESESLEGFFLGDIKGSVFADDSSLIVDSIDNRIITNKVTTTRLSVEEITTENNDLDLIFKIISNQLPNGLQIWASKGTEDNPLPTEVGNPVTSLVFRGYSGEELPDGTGYNLAGGLVTQWDSTADLTKLSPRSNMIIGLGDNTDGGGAIAMTIDWTGNVTAKAFTTGVYETNPADTRPTGVKGMIIFNDTSGKFQGFDGTSWVDLS